MSLNYTWEFVSAKEALLAGIIHTVTWRCTATDADGNTASIDGSTVFDDVAVLQNRAEALTGTRPEFVENPTDAQCLQWVIDVHNAADFRLSALEAMLKKSYTEILMMKCLLNRLEDRRGIKSIPGRTQLIKY